MAGGARLFPTGTSVWRDLVTTQVEEPHSVEQRRNPPRRLQCGRRQQRTRRWPIWGYYSCLLCLQHFQIDRVDAEQEFEQLVSRWSQLANIFDRFFFSVVLALNGGSTIFLLILAPSMDVPNLHDRVWEL